MAQPGKYDAITVGAGAASCVCANRLTADSNWKYYTVPQSGRFDRCIAWPHGRMLGGSGSVAAFVRTQSQSIYHPTSTCRMGTNEDAVVDPSTLKIRGLEGLRVCDASVFPDVGSSNIMSTVMMSAERGAQFMN